VIVNEEGWIVTAFHMVDLLAKMNDGAQKTRNREAEEARIRSDPTLDKRTRQKQVSSLGRLGKEDTDRCSVWWGRDGVTIPQFHTLPAADLAVGKLEPFDKTWVADYPTFKNPSMNFEPGTSLCKLGFPFHQITPTWDAAKNSFVLPPGSLPLPLFPIDGILTRFADIQVVGPAAPPTPLPFPLRFLETSTPGLRGQSGGPIFDTQGTVWAIQSRTFHLSLGFDAAVPGAKSGQKEHQFLNVGHGVHAATILGFFAQIGINANVSTY